MKMSRIDELIRELCPNGVEHKNLGSLGRRNKGTPITASRMKELHRDGAPIKIFAGGKTVADFPTDALPEKNIINEPSIIVKSRGHIGFEYYDKPFSHKNELWSYTINNHGVDQKFIYYYLLTKVKNLQELARATSVKLPQLSVKDTDSLKIPIPPLKVQREIVNILDKFTQLEAELSAELSARRKQYEYYRNQLFIFDESQIRWLELGELCKVSRGRVMSKDYLNDNAGEFPVYSSQTANNGIFGRINSYDYDFESITWTTDGANAGSVFYHNNEKFSITNVCGLLQVKTENLSTRFLYYALQMLTKPHVSAGMGNPKLMSNVMSKIKVPVPSMEEQNRIVNMLDNFDLLVNGISDGLPAEMKARRKQYEYYRTKLLTFQELSV